MSDSDEPDTVAELNSVTVHTTSGAEFDVEYVIRHTEKDWAYATHLRINDDGSEEPNHLVFSTEDIIAIDSRHIKMTDIPEIRIHHSGTGEDYSYEHADLAFEFSGPE